MKLKLEKNSIIFKLSQLEKETLTQVGQSLTETCIFPSNHLLHYTLLLTSDENAAIHYINNQMTLSLPCKIFDTLSTPSKEGISFDFDSLKVTVVVDLLPRKKTC